MSSPIMVLKIQIKTSNYKKYNKKCIRIYMTNKNKISKFPNVPLNLISIKIIRLNPLSMSMFMEWINFQKNKINVKPKNNKKQPLRKKLLIMWINTTNEINSSLLYNRLTLL